MTHVAHPTLLTLTSSLHHRILARVVAGIAILSSVTILSTAHAEEVQSNMSALLPPLREIQRYLVDEKAFTDPANRETVERLLTTLRSNFHTLETIPSRYHKLPGFDENVKQVRDLLDDSAHRFSEGKTAYAWWRTRSLPAHCFSCHATYKVTASYSNADAIDPSLDPINRARFLLATRQFAAAHDTLLEVLKDKKLTFFHDEALRSLLVVAIRIDRDPVKGRELFSKVRVDIILPEEQERDVDTWIKGFERWRDEAKKGAKPPSLDQAEHLITRGASKGIDYRQDDVSLIRGTAMVHDILEGEGMTSEQRKKALYLLGFAYAHTPVYFAESWSEMYLEQCINEFPGTHEAKRAYRIYRDHVADEFTGSSGTNLPPEVELQLETLRKKAHGELSAGPGRI